MDSETYLHELNNIRFKIPEMELQDFDLQFAAEKKSIAIALIFSILFGYLGADRLYLEQIWLALLKLITCGGFGIWTVVDWFLIAGATRGKNLQIAQELRTHDNFGVL